MARPKLPLSAQHSERIAVYLTEDELGYLVRLAADRGLAPAAVARELIRTGLTVKKFESLAQPIEGTVNASKPDPNTPIRSSGAG